MDDQKWEGCGLICLQHKKYVQKYHKGTDSQFVIKHNANNVFVIDHCTIAANKPKQMYLLMK